MLLLRGCVAERYCYVGVVLDGGNVTVLWGRKLLLRRVCLGDQMLLVRGCVL